MKLSSFKKLAWTWKVGTLLVCLLWSLVSFSFSVIYEGRWAVFLIKIKHTVITTMMCWKCHARLSLAAAVICTALCEALLTLRQTLILLHWKNAVDIVFRHCCLSLRSRANTLIANKYCLLFLAWPLEAVFLLATFWLLYLPTAWTATCLPLCLLGTFFSQRSSPNELTSFATTLPLLR